MTEQIKRKLQDEINALEHELVHELPKEIKKAAALGDLSENAEYHAAREDQGMLQARIDRLKEQLSRAYLVDKNSLPNDAVVFGTRVRVRDLGQFFFGGWIDRTEVFARARCDEFAADEKLIARFDFDVVARFRRRCVCPAIAEAQSSLAWWKRDPVVDRFLLAHDHGANARRFFARRYLPFCATRFHESGMAIG